MNRNTVMRALRLLRDEGLLELRRGAVLTQARELVRLARQHGYHRDELIQIIESLP
jgi:GntR family transcriptional regulator